MSDYLDMLQSYRKDKKRDLSESSSYSDMSDALGLLSGLEIDEQEEKVIMNETIKELQKK